MRVTYEVAEPPKPIFLLAPGKLFWLKPHREKSREAILVLHTTDTGGGYKILIIGTGLAGRATLAGSSTTSGHWHGVIEREFADDEQLILHGGN